MSVSLLLVVINSSAFPLFPSYLLLSSLQAFRFPRSLSYYLIFILPYPSLALAPVPLLPSCKRSLSLSLLWSYLHPGTWLQIITQEEEREKLSFYLQPQLQFIVELWMTEINSTPSLSPSLPFSPPFLHFQSVLSPTAGAFWRVKRPSFIWMPHFEFAAQQL